MEDPPTTIFEPPAAGRGADLIQALNAAAASLQRSAHSEEAVIAVFKEQIKNLGLRGGISLLDETGQHLVFLTTAYPDRIKKLIASLERLTKLNINQFQVKVDEVDTYRQAVATGQAVFTNSSGDIIKQMLPRPSRQFFGRILNVLGSVPAIYAPLKMEDKVVGLLNVAGENLTQEDTPALEAFANHVSIALENASFFSELQESEQKFRTLFETSPDSVTIIGPEGVILDINEATEKISGMSKDEVIGHHFDKIGILNAADLPKVIRLFWRVLRGQDLGPLELKIYPPHSEPLWVEVFLALLKKEDQVQAIQVIARDVTQRKKAEQEIRRLYREMEGRVLERTSQLLASNQELEAFSYSVSHDLRAPLRALDGFSRILLEEHASALPPEAQEYLSRVRENAQQMDQLIQDLLAFSRLGRKSLKKRNIDPADLVEQIIAELQDQFEGRQVEVVIGELDPCQADPALLKLVFLNLIENALKFTRHRESARIEIGCEQTEEGCVYFVRDNGIGFDMQYVDKLFGVFQRLHGEEEYEGTGVGLATVQRIIRRHGGHIWTEAEVDKGATFFFILGKESPLD